ncbi:MAG: hypothetical protein ACR2IK_11060 [Chloroflexota bacterium]
MTIPSLTTPTPNTSLTRTSARVVEVTAYGGPDVLRMRSIPRPEASAGRVRVAVAASTSTWSISSRAPARSPACCPT